MINKELAAFVDPILAVCASQFPRKCGNCGRFFPDFRSYIGSTGAVGAPQCSSEVSDPFGLISYRNCSCGSTVMLRCADPAMHDEFMLVLRRIAADTGRPAKELLIALRAEIHRRASKG